MSNARGSARRARQAAPAVIGAAVVVAVLAGCAAQEAPDSGSAAGEPRVVRQLDRPLLPDAGDGGERVFRDSLVRGTLSPSGRWQVRAEVTHPRLRCASYQLGLRFGSGDTGCKDVHWQTGVELLPSRSQCNGATLVHAGAGAVGMPLRQLGALSCVRVILRCSGACG
jgi:hypothetical protein